MTSPATPDAATAPESPPGTAPGAPPGTPPGSGIRPAPWVRTRLSAAPLTALLAAALAFVTVLLSAALPRAMDRGADQGLRSFLHDRGASATSVLVTSPRRTGRRARRAWTRRWPPCSPGPAPDTASRRAGRCTAPGASSRAPSTIPNWPAPRKFRRFST